MGLWERTILIPPWQLIRMGVLPMTVPVLLLVVTVIDAYSFVNSLHDIEDDRFDSGEWNSVDSVEDGERFQMTADAARVVKGWSETRAIEMLGPRVQN